MPFTELNGIPIWGKPQDNAVQQILNCQKTADYCALMADHHLGYAVPIGGVVAYEDQVSPSGVGFDIACGNKAVLLDADAGEVRAKINTIMDDIWKEISFGVGRKNKERVEHELFEDDPAWDIKAVGHLKGLAQNQLGTVGSGNHYVDLFVDESERVWCGVHFGSRGMGHKIATHFLRLAGGQDGMHVDPALLSVDSPEGQEYVAAMELAGRYAYAGRDWVCSKVASIMGAHILEEVHNHHNFAWRENHNGKDLWVVRKGATPAFPGQKGFIGGSMGEVSVIVQGVESEESRKALYSTVHGAGRVLSRRAAAGKFRWKRGKRIKMSEGAISQEMMMDWISKAGVVLRGAGTDESPHCYKRLPEVLEFHEPTIEVLHTLRPIGVAMAGADEFDPFKD
jgi:tRNA-splicing ligase RtcB